MPCPEQRATAAHNEIHLSGSNAHAPSPAPAKRPRFGEGAMSDEGHSGSGGDDDGENSGDGASARARHNSAVYSHLGADAVAEGWVPAQGRRRVGSAMAFAPGDGGHNHARNPAAPLTRIIRGYLRCCARCSGVIKPRCAARGHVFKHVGPEGGRAEGLRHVVGRVAG